MSSGWSKPLGKWLTNEKINKILPEVLEEHKQTKLTCSRMSSSSRETASVQGVQSSVSLVEVPTVLAINAITKGQGFTYETDPNNGFRLGGNCRDVSSEREARII